MTPIPMTTPPSETVKTRDLTLATYLISRGIEPQMIVDGHSQRGDAIGAWRFPDTELTRKCVQLFVTGDARVDPKEFHTTLTSTRRSLFTFLESAE